MIYTRQFYTGLGCLVYALVAADQKVQRAELEDAARSLLKAFGDRDMSTKGAYAHAAISRMIAEEHTSEEAYAQAMTDFAEVKNEMMHARPKIIQILEHVAKSDKEVSVLERELIQRFTNESMSV